MKREYRYILDVVNKQINKEELIEKYKDVSFDWQIVCGQLTNNRLIGYYFSNLPEELKNNIPKEIYHIFDLVCKAQYELTQKTIEVAAPVLDKMKENKIRYAGLKGISFLTGMYDFCERRSNDTDILVLEEELDQIDAILRELGYIQTYMHDGKFEEATRREKLIQRMNYHDTVPYGKQVDSIYLPYHFFDLNFQFDSKENNITKNIIDYGLDEKRGKGFSVNCLKWETNLAFLCIHYYREASNSIWIDSKRDLTLYKLVDIVNFIHTGEEKDYEMFYNIIDKFNLQKAAYFTLNACRDFYEDDYVIKEMHKRLEIDDKSFINNYVDDNTKEVRKRNIGIVEATFTI